MPILSLLTFLPLAGALVLAFLPRRREVLLRGLALAVALIALGLSVGLYLSFESGTGGMQFVEHAPWLGSGIEYHLGVDGISLFLVMLAAFLVPVSMLASWRSVSSKVKEFLIFMLVLETGIIGVFLSLNVFLFYVFWEAMLIPMYFLIGVWGGARRVYATMKFVLYTMLGSLLMLVAMIILHGRTGTFNLLEYYRLAGSGDWLDPRLQVWLFLAFALAFAVKVPLFPLHTWLPDAHVEAPTAGSVILAAVLLKMGAYGFLRFALPLFPEAVSKFLPYLSALSLVGVVYGGLMALVQKDIKSLVAYSSVSHMGLVMLAVFALNFEGVQGAVFQMVNHGLSTGALFLVVGLLYERSHTRRISDYGGLSRQMPVLSAFFMIAVLSSAGLPGLNGFVGEILCLFGVFRAGTLLAVLAVSTVILAAAYLLGLFQKVMHGPISNPAVRTFKDLNLREVLVLLPIIVLMFWLGLRPGSVLRKTEASAALQVSRVTGRSSVLVSTPAPSPLKAGKFSPLPLIREKRPAEEKDADD
ncbi:MAG: NADH-quinone oxidoreductase subunit M [Candidatus Aminicenantes bacterium]|nr:NADH-quinone oxidoreductase subunit M [Candidatus Aminicenantes bacterium]